jgi:hypothetical protein
MIFVFERERSVTCGFSHHLRWYEQSCSAVVRQVKWLLGRSCHRVIADVMYAEVSHMQSGEVGGDLGFAALLVV